MSEEPAIADLVTLLTDRALALSAQATREPSSVRISAGPVHVEICWPTSPPPGAAAGASTSAVVQPAGSVPHHGVDGGPAATPEASAATFPLCAGTVGTFYRSPEPGAAPFVTEGDRVQPGQQVAIIEAMKLMIPVEAERAGEVVEFLVADRAPVEYGQPLMLMREAGQ
jgi:acetyl-CoA carboxylase biotin carboxyl carrier protein